MAKWKLHTPTKDNQITRYRCGLVAGQRVRLKKDIVQKTYEGVPTGVIYRAGEIWTVLTGVTSDPVLWFRQPCGERCTWDDVAASVAEWFELAE